MDAETFYSEFFRVTHTTRKRMIHAQLGELDEIKFPPVFTVAETSVIYGQQLLQRALWRIRRGE